MAKPTRHRGKWLIRWFDDRGGRASEVYDDYRVALAKLREHEVAVEQIKRGMRSPEALDKTFGDLADCWIQKRAPLKRSGKDDESILRKHLRPAFGGSKLHDIGVEDGHDYILAHDDLSGKTVANDLALLGAMLRLATTFKVPWLMRAPKFAKPKIALFSKDYRYLRSDEEIRRFLSAARDEDEHVVVFYATALYTGMRAGELAVLEWGDVELEARRIIVQRSFSGPTKKEPFADVDQHASENDELLTYQQAAKLLNWILPTLYSKVSRREIPHIRIGCRFVRFSRRALQKWLAEQAVEAR